MVSPFAACHINISMRWLKSTRRHFNICRRETTGYFQPWQTNDLTSLKNIEWFRSNKCWNTTSNSGLFRQLYYINISKRWLPSERPLFETAFQYFLALKFLIFLNMASKSPPISSKIFSCQKQWSTAAEQETTVRDSVFTFVSLKPLDIFTQGWSPTFHRISSVGSHLQMLKHCLELSWTFLWETTLWYGISTFVSVKPLQVFDDRTGHLPALKISSCQQWSLPWQLHRINISIRWLQETTGYF